MTSDRAPIYADAFSLCEWLLARIGDDSRVLARHLCEDALLLLEAVGLALKGQQVVARLDEADERLIVLRLKLRLAAARGLLTEEQLMCAYQFTDAVGRQLGGWLRPIGASG